MKITKFRGKDENLWEMRIFRENVKIKGKIAKFGLKCENLVENRANRGKSRNLGEM